MTLFSLNLRVKESTLSLLSDLEKEIETRIKNVEGYKYTENR